jgi:transcriptional regulator with XRE-family HTH domain
VDRAAAGKAAGLTQTEVARRLGIRPQSVQAWESGVSALRARRLTELAQVLEVPEAFFFAEGEDEGDSVRKLSPTGAKARRVAEELVMLADGGKLDRESLEALERLTRLLARKES